MDNNKKDFYVLLIVSICISVFIYWIYGNSGIVRNQVDYLYFIVLVLSPFVLPVVQIMECRRGKDAIDE